MDKDPVEMSATSEGSTNPLNSSRERLGPPDDKHVSIDLFNDDHDKAALNRGGPENVEGSSSSLETAQSIAARFIEKLTHKSTSAGEVNVERRASDQQYQKGKMGRKTSAPYATASRNHGHLHTRHEMKKRHNNLEVEVLTPSGVQVPSLASPSTIVGTEELSSSAPVEGFSEAYITKQKSRTKSDYTPTKHSPVINVLGDKPLVPLSPLEEFTAVQKEAAPPKPAVSPQAVQPSLLSQNLAATTVNPLSGFNRSIAASPAPSFREAETQRNINLLAAYPLNNLNNWGNSSFGRFSSRPELAPYSQTNSHVPIPDFGLRPTTAPTNFNISEDTQSPVNNNANAINFERLEEHLKLCRESPRKDTIKGGLEKKGKYTFYCPELGALLGEGLDGFENVTGTLSGLLKRESFWLDIQDPTMAEMKLLANIFNIHPLTTEDVLQEGTREKIEVYHNYYFICYCAIDNNMDSITYAQSFNVYILVYSNFIVSFHFQPLASVSSVIKRLEQLKTFLHVTPHWINYAILDDITDKYGPMIQSVEMEVESIDDLVLVISHHEQMDMLRRISLARKRLTVFQRLMSAKLDVLRILIKRLESMSMGGTTFGIQTVTSPLQAAMIRDTCLYLGDVQDHVITMTQALSHVDTTLTRSHSNYLGQVSIEITAASNRANDMMAKLTALASILLPMNVITGLWGMNVRVPGMATDEDDLSWFFGIVGFLLILVVFGLIGYKYIERAFKSK